MANELITIDYIDDIRVNAEVHFNQFNVLQSLYIGMAHLAEFTRRREVEALEEYGKSQIVGRIEKTDLTLLLSSVFDWFAVSLVSYMRTVKLMEVMDDKGWELSDLQTKGNQKILGNAYDAYMESVAPDILEWRNKIAAHRMATEPRNDSLSNIFFSTIPSIGYESPYYRVGMFQVIQGRDSPRSNLPKWALTERFEQLAPRFWPEMHISELDW